MACAWAPAGMGNGDICPWKCCKVLSVSANLSEVSVDDVCIILRKCRQLLGDPHRGFAPGGLRPSDPLIALHPWK